MEAQGHAWLVFDRGTNVAFCSMQRCALPRLLSGSRRFKPLRVVHVVGAGPASSVGRGPRPSRGVLACRRNDECMCAGARAGPCGAPPRGAVPVGRPGGSCYTDTRLPCHTSAAPLADHPCCTMLLPQYFSLPLPTCAGHCSPRPAPRWRLLWILWTRRLPVQASTCWNAGQGTVFPSCW